MSTESGSLALLNSATAQELLHSTEMVQLAYTWTDGTPRVVPIWFTWSETVLVLGSPPIAPKVRALQRNPDVALTINSTGWPYKALLMRGQAELEIVDGIVPEYALSAQRYLGEEQGKAWCDQVSKMFPQMARIVVRPNWVEVLDFNTRFPVAIATAMAGQ